MNVVREIQSINELELKQGLTNTSGSWHHTYLNSPTAAYIFIGNLDYRLSEGDIICVASQYGEVVDCNLIRDNITGVSRGSCFIAYEDTRSTIVAIDNLNGYTLLGRTLRVDHADKYRRPKLLQNDTAQQQNKDTEFDIDLNDKLYDERRKLIWNYELYNKQTEVKQQQAVTISKHIDDSTSSANGVVDRNAARIAELMAKKRQRWKQEELQAKQQEQQNNDKFKR